MVASLRYDTGNEVRPGDRIRYQGQPGVVNFVALEKTGDPSIDWYIDEFRGGGFMIDANAFGHVFVSSRDIRDHVEFIGRADDGSEGTT
jgi:hypothetical protein